MTSHPYQRLKKSIRVGERSCVLFDITQLDSPNYPLCEIPKTIRVLLECAVRNCDGFKVTATDVENIVQWRDKVRKVEVPYCPARVLMQDFTGVPAVVDLAAMRQCADRLGVDPLRVNPLVPVDLVVDHSVQVDASRTKNAVDVNERIEFERNKERFQFLKWGSQAFEGLRIIPPGNGIVHQVNLEYLARVAFLAPVDDVTDEALLSYPDTLVGTDSHTTMVNGLGCLGWGVGGIEAEAAMLGQPCSLLLPSVVGVELTNELPPGATATDLVLTVTQVLRKHGVVDKLIEFYGEGARKLSLPDRATISNMAPEYGATCGFFPVDDETLAYLRQTGRPAEVVEGIRAVLSALGLFGIDSSETSKVKYSEVVKVDLATIEPCVAGPKRPQDRVLIRNLVEDFASCLGTDSGFKGFGVPADKVKHSAPLVIRGADGAEHTFPNVSHGFVSIAAITSCTNTSNPSVLIAAGLVARKARELGMSVPAYVKTSLSPGSQVVERYLSSSGLLDDLAHHGFTVAGYGCMTCIGNSGELYDGVGEFIKKEGIVSAAVLSGNRNFEARVHPLTVANYLCSPPLVVLFALAGTTNINLLEQPIGRCRSGKDVFFKDLWPTRAEIQAVTTQHVTASVFSSVYESIQKGNARWSDLETSADTRLYAWDPKSTYIHLPPFFQTLERALPALPSMSGCRCLLYLGDSVTTDHISPAGNIAPMSSAAQFLLQAGVAKQDFNTYGARRGNDEIMARGTFANTRLGNRLIQPSGTTGPVTMYLPDEISMSIFDASAKYRSEGTPLILLAGKEYGSGSSRDWAAKGPFMLGVCAVIAESFERIHRSNLVGMGIAPMCFQAGESAVTLGLTGKEVFNIPLREEDLKPLATVTVSACDKSGKVLKTFQVTLRFDTDAEITYYRNGGVLPYVLRSKIL